MSHRDQQDASHLSARISKTRAPAAPIRSTLKLDLAAHTITPVIPPRHILKLNFVKRTIESRTEVVEQQARIFKPKAASRFGKVNLEAIYAAEFQKRACCLCPWQSLCVECGGACEKCETDCCQTPVESTESDSEEMEERFEEEEEYERDRFKRLISREVESEEGEQSDEDEQSEEEDFEMAKFDRLKFEETESMEFQKSISEGLKLEQEDSAKKHVNILLRTILFD